MTTVHHVYCNSLMVHASIVYQIISVSHVAQTNHKPLHRSGKKGVSGYDGNQGMTSHEGMTQNQDTRVPLKTQLRC